MIMYYVIWNLFRECFDKIGIKYVLLIDMYENIEWCGDEKFCYFEIKKYYFDCFIGYRYVRLRSFNN